MKVEAPATARLFFALWPSRELAAALADIADQGARQLGGRATRQETIHLTLAFLGNIRLDQVPTLCRAAARVRSVPFWLDIDRLGFWQHNHLLWAGCSCPPPELPALAAALRHELAVEGFAADGGHPVFAPHVSLVRRVPVSGSDGAGALPVFASLHWPVERFVLVGSRLSPQGSAYQTIAEFPLLP